MAFSGAARVAWILALCAAATAKPPKEHREFCVVGAGPAGLQLGALFQADGADYVVLERANHVGSFFDAFPRHDTLISINKRSTGLTNTEFNLRHDWNSLLTAHPELQFSRYSKDFFPHRRDLLRYLDDFQKKLHIKVAFNTSVQNLRKLGRRFLLDDQLGGTWSCSVVVLATGLPLLNKPRFLGSELTLGYEEAPLDRSFYEGKSVLLLGKGNSAFETASHILGHTNLVHLISRSRVRLAWATHYVGDLRAVNTGLLDTYQLKSLDGIAEVDVENLAFKRLPNGRITIFDRRQSGPEYDVVIRCLGWNFDFGIFNSSLLAAQDVRPSSRERTKYPPIEDSFQVKNVPNLYVAGTASHSLDFRRSAGGFIHGFRYTARALHRMLSWRHAGRPWTDRWLPLSGLLDQLVRRVNEASGIYQMFGFLGDVAVLSRDGRSFAYLEEFPVAELARLPEVSGVKGGGAAFVVVFQYGQNFSGAGSDPFRENRASHNLHRPTDSNFLHPVFYFYRQLPTEEEMSAKHGDHILPRPHRLHHTVEDFETNFRSRANHVLPLKRFLAHSLDRGLDARSAETCLALALRSQHLPLACEGATLVSTLMRTNSW